MDKDLNKLKTQLQKIDVKILNALKQRSQLNKKIGDLKEQHHVYPKIDIIQEINTAYWLQKQDIGLYSHKVIQKVWRELTFNNYLINDDLIKVEVLSSAQANDALYTLASDHFGTYADITTSNDFKPTIQNLVSNVTTFVVIPFSNCDYRLWREIVSYPDIKVCMSLPFLVPSNKASSKALGLILSKAELKPYDSCNSLFLIEDKEPKVMPNIKIIFSNNNHHIALISGFTKDKEAIAQFANAPINKVFYLGSYPKSLSD